MCRVRHRNGAESAHDNTSDGIADAEARTRPHGNTERRRSALGHRHRHPERDIRERPEPDGRKPGPERPCGEIGATRGATESALQAQPGQSCIAVWAARRHE